jgi:hypothetical protein
MPDENSAPVPPNPNQNFNPSPAPNSFEPTPPPVPQESQPWQPVTPTPMMPPEKPKKRKVVLLIAATLLVLLLAAGYVFAVYLPKQPGNMYKAGLTNTGKALDSLITYAKEQKKTDYKASNFAASGHLKSAGGSYDLSLSGSVNKGGGATATVNADVVGEKVQADLRSVTAKGNTTPDIYLKVKAQKLLDGYGLAKYHDKWIVLDHTLIDTYARNFGGSTSASTDVTVPTSEQINDALSKMQEVNKTYIFTTDESKGVLQNEQYLGKSNVHGRDAYHYKVGYNKTHLQSYVKEAKKALDSSKLNDWSKSMGGKNLSEQSGFEALNKAIKDAKGNYKLDLWVDSSTRVVSQLQFADPKDSSSKFTLGQHYASGSLYPFSVGFTGKDGNGKPTNGSLDLSLDTETHKFTAAFKGKSQDASGKPVDVDGSLSVTPSNKTTDITAPDSATSVNDVMRDLFGGLMATTKPTIEEPAMNGFSIDI